MDDNFQGSHPTLMQTCHLAHVKKFEFWEMAHHRRPKVVIGRWGKQ